MSRDPFTLDLFGESPAASSGNPLEEEFWTYHRANPHVFERLDTMARIALAKGYTRYSSRTIIAVMRWERDIITNTRDFKINDHHSPYYGRLWMRLNPHLPRLFETRELLAGEVSEYLRLPEEVS